MTKSVFAYRNGALCVEALPLAEIAESVDTPFYCTSAKQLQRNYRCFVSPFEGLNATFHYSLRANANLAVLRILADYGSGAEITSTGELEKALEAGMLPSTMALSGLGKTQDDIAAALLAGVSQINVETLSELNMIEGVASVLGIVAPIVLRINPVLFLPPLSQAGKRIKTGISIDSLGDAIRIVLSSTNMVFKGLATHVDPTITDGSQHLDCYKKLAMIVTAMRGQGVEVERLGLGGGFLAFPNEPSQITTARFAEIVKDVIAPLGCALSFEPGRSIVADASVLVSRVLHVQDYEQERTIVLDAGMNDLMTSALRKIRHEIIPLRQCETENQSHVSIVGPLSDKEDVFGDGYKMPQLEARDLVAIMKVGAFGNGMASSYNGRALIPEVLVSGAQHALVRRRVAIAEQMGWEAIPDWMVISRAA